MDNMVEWKNAGHIFFLGGKWWRTQEKMKDADWQNPENHIPKPGVHMGLQVSSSEKETSYPIFRIFLSYFYHYPMQFLGRPSPIYEKLGHARCNGPAVFSCFGRRPKSRFEDPYSTLCFFPLCTCSMSYVNYRVSGFESRNSTAWKHEN